MKKICKKIISIILLLLFFFMITGRNISAYMKTRLDEGEDGVGRFYRVTSMDDVTEGSRYVLVSITYEDGKEHTDENITGKGVMSTLNSRSDGYRAGVDFEFESDGSIILDATSASKNSYTYGATPLYFRIHPTRQYSSDYYTNTDMYLFEALAGDYNERLDQMDSYTYYLSPLSERGNDGAINHPYQICLPLYHYSQQTLDWWVSIQSDGSLFMFSYTTYGNYDSRKTLTYLHSWIGPSNVMRFSTGNMYPDENGLFKTNVYLYKEKCEHTNVTKVDAKPSTCIEHGNIEYYYCQSCMKCFLDSALLNEIKLSDTILPLVEHTYKDNICLVCDKELKNGYFKEFSYKDVTSFSDDIYIITNLDKTKALSEKLDDGKILGGDISLYNSELYKTDSDKCAFLKFNQNFFSLNLVITIMIGDKYLGYEKVDDTYQLVLSEYEYPWACDFKDDKYELCIEDYWLGKQYLSYSSDAFSLTMEESQVILMVASCPHEHLEVYDKKDATCEKEGIKTKYWYCPDCEKYFSSYSDEAKIELNESEVKDLFIPALGHDYNEFLICNRCGVKAPSYKEVKSIDELSKGGTFIFVSEYEGKVYAFGYPMKAGADGDKYKISDSVDAIEVHPNLDGSITLGNTNACEFELIKCKYLDTDITNKDLVLFMMKSNKGYIIEERYNGFHLEDEQFNMPCLFGFVEDRFVLVNFDDAMRDIIDPDYFHFAFYEKPYFGTAYESFDTPTAPVKIYRADKPLKIDGDKVVVEGDKDDALVTVPSYTWRQIIDNDDVASVEIKTQDGAVKYDKDAMKTILDALGESGDITLLFEDEFDYDEVLTEKQKELILNTDNAYGIYNIVIKAGDNEIHDLNGRATITVRFDLEEGTSIDDIIVVRVNEDGSKTEFTIAYEQDEDTNLGYLSWTTETHSVYMVTKTETSVRPKPATIDASPKKDFTWLWITIGVIALGAIAGTSFYLLKKRQTSKN